MYVNVLFVYISVYNVSVYVEMFIPYHMYVCVYVNIFTDTRIHCRAGPAVLYFATLASMTAKRLTEATPHLSV